MAVGAISTFVLVDLRTDDTQNETRCEKQIVYAKVLPKNAVLNCVTSKRKMQRKILLQVNSKQIKL